MNQQETKSGGIGAGKTICFDLDGVLCEQTEGDYSIAKPNPKAIAALNKMYDAGFKIIIHTSRYMGRCKSDPVAAHNMGYEQTKTQLKSWGVRFHDLYLGKPRYDIVIDDRSLFFNPEWPENFDLSVLTARFSGSPKP